MKTLGVVLAIVAVITATGVKIPVDIPEYSKKNLDAMGYYKPYAEKITATVINANVPMHFYRARKEFNALNFITTPILIEETADHVECGFSVGINIHGVSTYCYADVAQVKVVHERNTDKINSMIMYLRFDIDTYKPLMLEIPIYKAPEKYASNPRKLETWAAKHEVGSLFPFKSDSEIVSDFMWLDAILKYGLYAAVDPFRLDIGAQITPITTYVTRPVVLPNQIIQQLFDGCM